MARKNKRKFGGSGTKVGNLLRKVAPIYKQAVGGAVNMIPKVNLAGTAINAIRGNKPPVPNLIQQGPMNPNVQAYGNLVKSQKDQRAMKERAMTADYVATGKSQFYDNEYAGVLPDQGNVGGGNAGGSVLGSEDYNPQGVAGGESMGQPEVQAGVPFRNDEQYQTYGGGSYAGGDPNAGVKPIETPSFLRAGVSNTGSGTALGSQTAGGGQRGMGIDGTGIVDPVYANLIKQFEKDSQLNLNLDKIKAKTRRDAQSEIDAVNAIYQDMIGRAQRTGQESLGSERAMQARSGTLASSFGQGAMQTQRENTDKNVGEIENQRANALSTVYENSRNQALQEYDRLSQLRSTGIDGYMTAMEKERGMLDEGLANVAQSLAYQGFDGNDLGQEGLAKIAQDWKVSPEVVFNKIMEKRSELDNAVEERAGAMQKAGIGETESNFESFSQESIAMSVLPTQLRNSDAEREYYQTGIKQGLEQGMDPYDIADVLMGYNITNKDELSTNIRQLIGQSELTPAKIADIARNLNSGNKSNALAIVENSIMARAKKETDSFVSEAMTKTAYDRSSELRTKIAGLKKSPIGVTSGTMEKWLGKLRGKESSKLMADIVRQGAQMRKEFSGSAVTPSEERFLAPIIPDLADKPDVFMYKLQALGNEPLRQLNNIRSQYGLIELDDMSLRDKNVRVEDYYGITIGGQPQQQAPVGQTQSSGGGGGFSW